MSGGGRAGLLVDFGSFLHNPFLLYLNVYASFISVAGKTTSTGVVVEKPQMKCASQILIEISFVLVGVVWAHLENNPTCFPYNTKLNGI